VTVPFGLQNRSIPVLMTPFIKGVSVFAQPSDTLPILCESYD
jgi:hypothetical protein